MRKIPPIALVCLALAACGQPLPVAPPESGQAAQPPVAPAATPAPVAAAAASGLIGAQLAAALGRADQAALDQTTETALETAPANQVTPWRNAGSGNYGTVTPGPIYQIQGHYCRDFTQTIVVGGRQQQGQGKACKQASGGWQLVP